MIKTKVKDVVLVELQVIRSRGDSLYIFEEVDKFFKIKRIFTVSGQDIKDADRGHHAHRRDQQIVTCPSGAISLTLKDGTSKRVFEIDSPEKAVYVPTYIWGETAYLEEETVVSVYSSEYYDESSYIRDYNLFLRIRNHPRGEDL